MNHLELFSGTHSFGKVSSKLGYNVYSLDRDLGAVDKEYKSKNHFKEDIMTWNYKQFDRGFFKIITASPVCLWWSNLRNTWIGRKLKGMDRPFTKEDINNDIENLGIPMVDKVFEIIDYFDPEYFIIENPKTARMKEYINDLIPYYDVDYCRYSNWGYKKSTRFWTNIPDLEFIPCGNKCDNMVTINTQEGAKHTGYGTLIKSKTRTLHTSQIGDSGSKKTNIKKHIKSVDGGKKKIQLLHKDRMGTSKTINDNGKIIRVNTAELRNKYKDYENINNKLSNGSTILERYRIPPKVIEKFFNKI